MKHTDGINNNNKLKTERTGKDIDYCLPKGKHQTNCISITHFKKQVAEIIIRIISNLIAGTDPILYSTRRVFSELGN